MDLNINANEFLVEYELSKGRVSMFHLLECRYLAGEVALALVLLLQEVSGQIVHDLVEKRQIY